MPRYHVRRTDREITAPEELRDVLRQGRFTTIAFARDNEPYLVTLSYGYDTESDSLVCHVAPEGCKLDFLRANPRICGTVVLDGGYEQGACKHYYTSVVFRGEAALIEDAEERVRGMHVLIDHLEDEPESVKVRNAIDSAKLYERMSVLRIRIDEITGKRGS